MKTNLSFCRPSMSGMGLDLASGGLLTQLHQQARIQEQMLSFPSLRVPVSGILIATYFHSSVRVIIQEYLRALIMLRTLCLIKLRRKTFQVSLWEYILGFTVIYWFTWTLLEKKKSIEEHWDGRTHCQYNSGLFNLLPRMSNGRAQVEILHHAEPQNVKAICFDW